MFQEKPIFFSGKKKKISLQFLTFFKDTERKTKDKTLNIRKGLFFPPKGEKT